MSPLLSVFFQHPEFSFLLKERVCPLIIKLFSPSIKHRVSSSPTVEKPLYPVAVRLLRIVSVLIEKFYTLLVRIFLKWIWTCKPEYQDAYSRHCSHTYLVVSKRRICLLINIARLEFEESKLKTEDDGCQNMSSN